MCSFIDGSLGCICVRLECDYAGASAILDKRQTCWAQQHTRQWGAMRVQFVNYQIRINSQIVKFCNREPCRLSSSSFWINYLCATSTYFSQACLKTTQNRGTSAPHRYHSALKTSQIHTQALLYVTVLVAKQQNTGQANISLHLASRLHGELWFVSQQPTAVPAGQLDLSRGAHRDKAKDSGTRATSQGLASLPQPFPTLMNY